MEDNLVTRVKLAWEKTPFITKNFFRASAILTIYGWLLNGNQWPGWLDLRWKPTLFRFQLWRPFTSFLFFGPFGLNYLLTSHFVWTYMGELERMHFQQPEVFLVMMTFGAACLLAVTTALGLSSAFLGHSLSCYLVYVWSRTYEGADVNVLDMFTLRAELLPWFFVIQVGWSSCDLLFISFFAMSVHSRLLTYMSAVLLLLV
jgi:Derlin-2/3